MMKLGFLILVVCIAALMLLFWRANGPGEKERGLVLKSVEHPAGVTGIMFNEDASHFFHARRAMKKLSLAEVEAFVDQYADTQIKAMLFNPNCQRTSYDSKVWTPVWKGLDPNGPDNQPLFASVPTNEQKSARAWIQLAWQLNQDGIDPYKVWTERCRKLGIAPWISMRMNDIHGVHDPNYYLHGDFWRAHPEFRRVNYTEGMVGDWSDNALDYGHPEVREYHMKLIRELAQRYDFDGFEMDFMRFGYLFRPGHEAEGAKQLTEFIREARRVMDAAEKRVGHRIALSARVPYRPETALLMGYDVATWAQEGLIDWIVPTPFFQTIDNDMPIDIWKRLLLKTKVKIAAGLEAGISPTLSFPRQGNSIETLRGSAASYLVRGADRIYTFNMFDSVPADPRHHKVMSEIGDLKTIRGKTRRHVLTYHDVAAPGEPKIYQLPVTTYPGAHYRFRIHTGPKPDTEEVSVMLGSETGAFDASTLTVRVNGFVCAFSGDVKLQNPAPTGPVCGYSVPKSAMNEGYNLIEIRALKAVTVNWVEFYFKGS
ncbi:MAG: hypothetical protein NT011_05300 [Kiritimatiellaeota bacterium]|nr:hypothetical protein [Kiritimatiellota bacterium]